MAFGADYTQLHSPRAPESTRGTGTSFIQRGQGFTVLLVSAEIKGLGSCPQGAESPQKTQTPHYNVIHSQMEVQFRGESFGSLPWEGRKFSCKVRSVGACPSLPSHAPLCGCSAIAEVGLTRVGMLLGE